ncbi:MAG: RNA polymerase subunit sigma [Solibacillus sp.]
MSLKGVELQIAIPKTFDAGKIADQHHQNTINQQLHANEALKRDIQRKQFSVLESEDLDGISEEDQRHQEHEQQQQNKKKQASKKEKAQHPFKGNFFDFSG